MKELRVPATLGACADLLYRLRADRLKLTAQVEALKQQEKRLGDHLSKNLKADDAVGVIGRVAQVTMHSADVGKAVDWDAFYAHVRKTGHFDLLERRLSNSALRERWAAEEAIPGITPQKIFSLSVTKRAAR